MWLLQPRAEGWEPTASGTSRGGGQRAGHKSLVHEEGELDEGDSPRAVLGDKGDTSPDPSIIFKPFTPGWRQRCPQTPPGCPVPCAHRAPASHSSSSHRDFQQIWGEAATPHTLRGQLEHPHTQGTHGICVPRASVTPRHRLPYVCSQQDFGTGTPQAGSATLTLSAELMLFFCCYFLNEGASCTSPLSATRPSNFRDQ